VFVAEFFLHIHTLILTYFKIIKKHFKREKNVKTLTVQI